VSAWAGGIFGRALIVTGMLLLIAPACFAGHRIVIAGSTARYSFSLPQDSFELSWVHSVELTWWRESYSVSPSGEIVLVASEYSSAGAGLPDWISPGEHFEISNGKMRLFDRHVPVGDLRVRLSDVSHHYLFIQDRVMDLNGLFGEGLVRIWVDKTQKEENNERN
jgi:hypothetical protein